MATQFKIKGNQFIVEDSVRHVRFVSVPVNTVRPLRRQEGAENWFGFANNSPTVNNYNITKLNMIGLVDNFDPTTLGEAPTEQRYWTEFADIVDENDAPFASADALDLWLCQNLGGDFAPVAVKNSVEIDSGSIQLVGDQLSPSNSSYYGTSSIGTKGFHALPSLDFRIVVTQSNYATTIGGVIDSTKEYFLDGIIDIGATQITIPAGGIEIAGFSFNISGLTSSEDNYTMFISDVGGSGDVLGTNYLIEVSGVNSQVYDLVDVDGFHAFECQIINYNNCTSLGEITDYRQGLEIGTGRFGGSPSLTMSGTWLGGFRVTTSIVRSLDPAMTDPLFKTGAGLSINSRFLTDINIDLPTLAAFADFAPVNFVNPSTFQIQSALFTRNGVSDATDTNICPNITESDLQSSWVDNIGLTNTFVGGTLTVTSETTTVIGSSGVFETLLATWTVSDEQHFDVPASGQLRHLGDNPREFVFIGDFTVDSNPNNELTIRLKKWDDSAASFVTVFDQTRQVNSLVGGRDVAFFTIFTNVTLDRNDYIFL